MINRSFRASCVDQDAAEANKEELIDAWSECYKTRMQQMEEAEGFQDWEQNKKNRRREEKWHSQYARHTVGNAGDMVRWLSRSCSWCKHAPKDDDFTWFYFQEGTADETANKRMTGMWCANCGPQHSQTQVWMRYHHARHRRRR